MTVLSIIIPMFNSQNTLRECLDSIGDNKAIEVILVDDGSTDLTRTICEDYIKNNSNFKYIYQQNKGPGAARNLGIKKAKGNYIMFLDSDDYLDQFTLVDIIDNKLSSGFDIIYYDFDQVDESGKILRRHRLAGYNTLNKNQLITSTLSWKLPWGQFKIISRKIIQSQNIRFAEDSNDSEELVFTLNCLEKAQNIIFYGSVLYKYVRRRNSLSKSHNGMDLLRHRTKIILSLKNKYQNKYLVGFNNYCFVTYIHLLKLFAERTKGLEGYNHYLNNCKKEVVKLKTQIDVNYLEKSYKLLYVAINLKLDLLLYIGFKLRGYVIQKYAESKR